MSHVYLLVVVVVDWRLVVCESVAWMTHAECP